MEVEKPDPIMHNTNPMTHILNVSAGISGSSTLDTDARSSGQGESSSSTASKSDPVLINSRLSRSGNSLKPRETLAELAESSVLSIHMARVFFDTSASTSSSSKSLSLSVIVGGACPKDGEGSSTQRPRWLPVRTESLDAAPPLAWVVWDAGGSWAVSKRRRR